MKGRISWLFLLAFIGANLLSILAVEEEADKETCVGMCVKLFRKAGAIGLYRCKNKGKKKFLILKLANITQLDKDGNKVGKVVYSLNKQNYNFSKTVSTDNYLGIDARKIEMSATHSSGASISVTAYAACEAGEVTWGDETYNVKKGDMKLIYKIEKYPWCNGTNDTYCKAGEVGKYLDLGLKVVSREGKPPKKGQVIRKKKGFECYRSKPGDNCSTPMDLGEKGDAMYASKEVESDGTFRSMVDGYPKIENKLVVFRVSNFSIRIRIDPAVTLGEDYDDSSDAAAIQLNIVCIVAMVIALFTSM